MCIPSTVNFCSEIKNFCFNAVPIIYIYFFFFIENTLFTKYHENVILIMKVFNTIAYFYNLLQGY